MAKSGQLFVFEGPDGAGKTTLAKELVAYLNSQQIPCEYRSFPGRDEGTLGHHVYELHHKPTHFDVQSITPTSKQLLHIAAHLEAIDTIIAPALQAGRHVVLDRFWWSTWVYGLNSGANLETLKKMLELEETHWGRIQPAVVFLVKRPTPIDRDDQLEQWTQLVKSYDDLAAQQAHRYPIRVIDNDGALAESSAQIVKVAEQALDNTLTVLPIQQPDLASNAQTLVQEQLPLEMARTLHPQAPVTLLTTFSRLSPAVPSEVYDTYWYFAAERQDIFFRRFAGDNGPWTNDPILGRYKFTNAYRASDRVSQYLIQNVIYQGDQTAEEVFFRILLFKIFNRIETWELLEKEVGPVTYRDFSFAHYDSILTRAKAAGTIIFSGAYIMPSGRGGFDDPKKHRNYLKVLELMMADEVPLRIQDACSMPDVFELLHSYPLLGDFLAYQYAIDINYSTLTNFSEMAFVMPGPGAKSGIRKCFRSLGGLTEAEIIRVVTERQEEEFVRLGISFQSLWGRRLQLIDCQNLFCEVDKYARIAHPEVAGLSGRSQIKQKYRLNVKPIRYWYPPKWGINDQIKEL